MIRNVVVGVLKDGVTAERAEVALQALRDLRIEGIEFTLVAGLDLGLREGNASYAITADLGGVEDYRVYDLDEEHNRIRRELLAPISASTQRTQFEL